MTRTRLAQPPIKSADWLSFCTPSARRCLLLTHIVLSVTMYGQNLSEVQSIAGIDTYLRGMLTTTQKCLSQIPTRHKRSWVMKRIECIHELYYTLALLNPLCLHYGPVSELLSITRSLSMSPAPAFLTQSAN